MPAALTALVHALEAEPSVRLAVLFGSGARGRLHARSDLDLGVIGPTMEQLGMLQVHLSRAAGREVDLIALETAPPLLRFEIAKDGRVLIERDPHLWIDFKARAMIAWWDWAPTARLFYETAAARLRERALHGPS